MHGIERGLERRLGLLSNEISPARVHSIPVKYIDIIAHGMDAAKAAVKRQYEVDHGTIVGKDEMKIYIVQF